jgi:hypothetical protein
MMLKQKTLQAPLAARDPIGRTRAPYSASEFLFDARLILAWTSTTSKDTPCFVECLDGQLISIETRLLLKAGSRRSEVLSIFCDTYGLEEGLWRASRFRAVVEFLEEYRDAVVRAGLAYDRRPINVRREFVEFLLNHDGGVGPRKIPETALARFLDEWGHRWI